MKSDPWDRPAAWITTATAFTVSVVGFAVDWERLGWLAPLGVPEAAALLFIPLFLASIYGAMRLVGLNPRGSVLGMGPLLWWSIAGFLTAVVVAPGAPSGKLWFITLLTITIAFGYWTWRQMLRAEENAMAKVRRRRM